jgi:hypothetical protein
MSAIWLLFDVVSCIPHSHTINMSSDVEMIDLSDLDSEPTVPIAADVTAACTRGPAHTIHKGRRYNWVLHEDNTRAFSKPCVI